MATDGDGDNPKPKRQRTEGAVVFQVSDTSKAEILARRVVSEPSLVAAVCTGFLSSKPSWTRLTEWASRLCSLGEDAKDELLYWETYLTKDNETAHEQLLRQVREDLNDMALRLVDQGVSESAASVASETWAVEALCDLLGHLLTLLEAGADAATSTQTLSVEVQDKTTAPPPERCFFAVRLDICQEGCTKFHDDTRFTTLRLMLPILGPGPVLATCDSVNWEFWGKEDGLLEQIAEAEPVEAAALVRSWNEKLCDPSKELATSEGSLIILKGSANTDRPLLHRATYLPEIASQKCPAQLVITFDHVTADVRDQLIEMNLDPEDDEEGTEEEEGPE